MNEQLEETLTANGRKVTLTSDEKQLLKKNISAVVEASAVMVMGDEKEGAHEDSLRSITEEANLPL